jgi:hypothetical protein
LSEKVASITHFTEEAELMINHKIKITIKITVSDPNVDIDTSHNIILKHRKQ